MDNVDWKGREFDIKPHVEKVVLPSMLYTLIEALQKRGIEFRTDVLVHLNRATIAPISGMTDMAAQLIARVAVEHCDALIRTLKCDGVREAIFVICLFIEKLVAEERFLDPGNQAVLVAMLIIEEAKLDDQAGWPELKAKYLAQASDLLREANRRGLFVRLLV